MRDDEFNRIMEFFKLSPQDKERRLKEVFEDSIKYFEHFKQIMIEGSPEEKQEAVEHVMTMKKKIEEEANKIKQKTGLSEEELAKLSNDPKNFSADQWETIQSAKKQLEDSVLEFKEQVEREQKQPTQKKEGDKKHKKPKNWISS